MLFLGNSASCCDVSYELPQAVVVVMQTVRNFPLEVAKVPDPLVSYLFSICFVGVPAEYYPCFFRGDGEINGSNGVSAGTLSVRPRRFQGGEES